jgi:hypothetical protein
MPEVLLLVLLLVALPGWLLAEGACHAGTVSREAVLLLLVLWVVVVMRARWLLLPPTLRGILPRQGLTLLLLLLLL